MSSAVIMITGNAAITSIATTDQIERALDEAAQPVLPVAVAIDEPAGAAHVQRHMAVDALEEAGKVGNLDAVKAASEQFPQRQHAAALLPHRDHDFVDAVMLDRVRKRFAPADDALRGDRHFLA